MAADQEQSQAKTESATPRRREEARKKGQVAYSTDLGSSCILLVGVGTFWLGGSAIGQNLLETFRSAFRQVGQQELDVAVASLMAESFFHRFLRTTGLLLGLVSLTGFAAGAIQSGLSFSTDSVQPDFSRLSPIKGWSRIWSQRSVVRSATAVLKVIALGSVAWWIIDCQATAISSSGRRSLAAAVSSGWTITIQIALAAAAGLVLMGMLDYLFQWWRHEQDLKMSRQDIKEEQKQEEGDPHVKARVKRLQREAAQRRMLRHVPKATVIVTNPTHFAVALQYDQTIMSAPKVTAKGADILAKRIIKIAKEHHIPILQRPPLARVLYASVATGHEVPPALYRAIAEILAHVFRLRAMA